MKDRDIRDLLKAEADDIDELIESLDYIEAPEQDNTLLNLQAAWWRLKECLELVLNKELT